MLISGVYRPQYLPEGWAPFVQPEGQLYFAREAKDLRVATDAHMYTKSICEEIVRFTSVVGKIIESKNIALPASAELYLRPDPEDGTCGYYFVDHATHALFWLEPLGTDDLGLDEPYSELNLRMCTNLGETPILTDRLHRLPARRALLDARRILPVSPP